MLFSLSPSTPEELLRRAGLRAFRPGQRAAVLAALQGRDSLVGMPTGAGKSLCYQLPALAAGNGLVIVVSPLISLMVDQWRALQRTGVYAVMLASAMPDRHNSQALADIRSSRARLVLVTPERFGSRAFAAALAKRRVVLFAVDEAHCIADWGHDFRPDYLRLGDAIAALGRPPVMALSATATPSVTQEITARLRLRDWVEVRSGFDRPNLTFDVLHIEGARVATRKQTALLHVLSERIDDPPTLPAIVYCGTRKETELLAVILRKHAIATVAYHAGMSPADRRASQQAFMEGRVDVVVATSAFGMGIHKANVRTVVHWSIPTSLESYYQEAGRAGRDGRPARAVLLAARMDLRRLIHFNTQRQASVAGLQAYLARLAAGAPGAGIGRSSSTGTDRILLSIAERSGALALQRNADGYLRVELTGTLNTRTASRLTRLASDRAWSSYHAIERFISNTETCRRRQILAHFGDSLSDVPTVRCCDVCAPDETLRAAVHYPPGYAPSRSHRLGCASPGSTASLSTTATAGAYRNRGLPQSVDGVRFQRLSEWRRERAKGRPAYTVAPNAVLEQVLRTRPGSLDDLLEIRGIGPAFCAKHGDSLLRTLAEMYPAAVVDAAASLP